ncbi:N-acetylglutamate synthase, GNAT family [Parageobacillus thermantarcticus]|uniref:N-acetylglutamate synthase, GNAT family n=1 Tax=Parageobacillus thermantarcticus TaxID=186116 RepID=A0A1I0TGD6_9BACL|nr:GNAT family N-acetyltransferase [Parageobacillus thermantarcticus]SFA50862.1 N-acetylglutamate synthase, GNAT family [Parageobacillus thermantarcticus]
MKIRKAVIKDVPELASLMEQLGYPTTVESMTIRFNNIESNPSYHTLVAEMNGKVVGMIGLCTGVLYEKDGLYARVIAFVVDSNYRNKGIGKLLIKEAERWARNQGAHSIVLNSGNRPERKNAHEFYKHMGYIEKSTGFAKSLS